MFQTMLNKLVQLVQVDIGKKLASNISQRQALPRFGGKTSYNFSDKPKCVRFAYFAFYKAEKDFLIDRIKEFAYIALEHISGPVIILGYYFSKSLET